MDVSTPTKGLIKGLDKFKPDVILSYPAIFQHLAFLKRKGYGRNVNPTVLYSAGSILDEYTRKYAQDAFGCPLLNTYQSVEAHGEFVLQKVQWGPVEGGTVTNDESSLSLVEILDCPPSNSFFQFIQLFIRE